MLPNASILNFSMKNLAYKDYLKYGLGFSRKHNKTTNTAENGTEIKEIKKL
jgi:hypothetical protein